MDTSIIKQLEYTVYLITCLVNGKKYIGITIQPLNLRLQAHFSKSRVTSDNRKFYNAIRKYGQDNFCIERLDTAISYDELKEKEKKYIQEFDTYNNGYNSTMGGDGTVGLSPTDETKEKHRRNKVKYFEDQENRDKYSRMNAVFSDEQVLEICKLADSGDFNTYELSDLFQTTEPTISEILRGKLYRHVVRKHFGVREIESKRMLVKNCKIMSLYNQGLEFAEIGRNVGLDANTIHRKIKNILGHTPITPAMRAIECRDRLIVEYRKSGKSISEISDLVAISVDAVRRQLKKVGIYKPDDSKGRPRTD